MSDISVCYPACYRSGAPEEEGILICGRYHKLTRDKLTASFASTTKRENDMKRYFLVITLAMISLNAYAGLNKWVDAEGKVHYSDTPPPEVKTQSVRNISGKGQADAPASFAPKSLAEREAAMKKSKQAKEDDSQKKAEQENIEETKRRNCEASRQNKKTIEDGVRVTTYDEKGERTVMDDSARAQQLEEANKAISANCN
jgi:type IV secretory pathway VirB10-like protein